MVLQKISPATMTRKRKAAPVELAYVWLPIASLKQGDSIVTADQEMQILSITAQAGDWALRLLNLATRQRTEELFRANTYTYTKNTPEVKERVLTEKKGEKE